MKRHKGAGEGRQRIWDRIGTNALGSGSPALRAAFAGPASPTGATELPNGFRHRPGRRAVHRRLEHAFGWAQRRGAPPSIAHTPDLSLNRARGVTRGGAARSFVRLIT